MHQQDIDLPLVSANLQGNGIQPFIVVEHADKRIGITGISTTGHPSIETPGFTRKPSVKAALPIVENLRKSTDIVILFAHGVPEEAKRLARTGHVDVVIDTNEHRSFEPPFRVGEAFWVRSHVQGMRIGELRIGAGKEWAIDRKIDLDDSIPNHPRLQPLYEAASGEIETLKKELFSR